VKQEKTSFAPSLVSTLAIALALVLFLPGCGAHRSSSEPQQIPDVAAAQAGPSETGVTADGAGDAAPAFVEKAPEDSVAVYDNAFVVQDPDAEAFEYANEDDLVVEETVVDPSVLTAEALEACESARIFWEEGDIEEALSALDRAYELLLEIPADEPELVQPKEDLRHLISQRIVEIYRSRLTSATDLGSSIPVEMNPHVEREIKSFQNGERSFFMESYRRSGLYRPMIVRMLRDAGMPEELSWLPLVESGFKTRALSRARALGMWQFISSTGYRFGLSRSHWIDQRMDPEESTRAAIEYLTELHGMFGDWMTALAGYNCGENRVMRVIKRQENGYLDHFWDLFGQLPWETARYVPRFLATLLIVSDPEAYGFDLPEPLSPIPYETVTIQRHVELATLDRALGLDKKTLATLNPELRRGVTPDEAYSLNVPTAVAPTFDVTLAELPRYTPPQQSYAVHRVRSGETLSGIARRHGTSVSAIVRANNLRSRNRIYKGQRLKIPQRGAPSRPPVAVATSGEANSMTHSVRSGDSLWKLASRYGTTVDRIKRDNGLRGDRLYVGQKLKINTGIPSGSRTYAVRRGDTIGKIAKAHRVSLNAVLRANGLSRSSTIYPGQVLIIPN
jgi:membrane-bound lytic murein transglycosylase D